MYKRQTQNGASYGAYGAVRRVGPNIAAKKGAIGYIMRSLGTDNKRSPHTGVTRFEDWVLPIPSAALSIPDAENLDRMLKRAKGDLTIHLTLTPKQTGMQQSGNLIAEVQGSDPNAGIVVVAGHLDSWDLGTGAIDDGAGVAIVAAAAKNIMDMGKPKRTIRAVSYTHLDVYKRQAGEVARAARRRGRERKRALNLFFQNSLREFPLSHDKS